MDRTYRYRSVVIDNVRISCGFFQNWYNYARSKYLSTYAVESIQLYIRLPTASSAPLNSSISDVHG